MFASGYGEKQCVYPAALSIGFITHRWCSTYTATRQNPRNARVTTQWCQSVLLPAGYTFRGVYVCGDTDSDGHVKDNNTDNGFIYNGFQQTDEQSFCRTLYLKQSLHT